MTGSMSHSMARGGRADGSAEWIALTACASPAADAAFLCKALSDADWPALLALAEDHGVTQLLAATAQRLPSESVPAGARATLAERQRAQAFFTLRMSAELFRLAQRFAEAFPERNSAMLVVKGPALAMQAYGDAAMRNYGDLDLLVRHADIARATQLMINAGYQPQIPLSAIAAGRIPGQYMFRQREAKLLVELHNDRTMRYYPRPLPIEQLFARSVRVPMDGREIPATVHRRSPDFDLHPRRETFLGTLDVDCRRGRADYAASRNTLAASAAISKGRGRGNHAARRIAAGRECFATPTAARDFGPRASRRRGAKNGDASLAVASRSG